jgi:SAM-dependent methyltransferase
MVDSLQTSAVAKARPGSRLASITKVLKRITLVPQQMKQGRHIDPLLEGAPDFSEWPPDRIAAWRSPEMATFNDCLRKGSLDVRQSILTELSEFYGYPIVECYERCIDWEAWSREEWERGDRSTPEGVQDFYDTVQSWSFDLMWYSYLQAAGFGYTASVLAVRYAKEKCPGGRHLDFGSGVGITSQVFARSGFASHSADVSKPLLAFASWRFAQHGDNITCINLTEQGLETAAYDIVTAVDTLVHVTDFEAAVSNLHRAIRPGGLLLTNFDVRDSDSPESASHLHNDRLMLEHGLEEGGFARCDTIAGVTQVYRRVDLDDPAAIRRIRRLRRTLPLRRGANFLKRVRLPTPKRLASVGSKLTSRLLGKPAR